MTEREIKKFNEDQRWSSYLLFAVGLYVLLVTAVIGIITLIGWVV